MTIYLKDVLTKQEWRETMWALKQTKKYFGEDDYYLFKKMVIVVGFIYGLQGFISYLAFIRSARDLIRNKVTPLRTFCFHSRKMNEQFFGVPKNLIYGNTFEQLRKYMMEKRIRMLKLEFPLKQNN